MSERVTGAEIAQIAEEHWAADNPAYLNEKIDTLLLAIDQKDKSIIKAVKFIKSHQKCPPVHCRMIYNKSYQECMQNGCTTCIFEWIYAEDKE